MPRLVPRIGIVAVANPLEVGAALAPDLGSAVIAAFASIGDCSDGGVVTTADAAAVVGRRFAAEGVDAIVAVAASWFEDYLLLDLLEEHRVPLVLWAVPGMETGSLCGCQQACYMARLLGRECDVVYAPVDGDLPAPVRVAVTAAALQRRLRRARIGLLGHRVEGMTETAVNELALKRHLGPRVVGIDSAAFSERVAAVDAAAAESAWRSACEDVGHVSSSEQDGVLSTATYLALRDTVAELGLAAVAVGCYPRLMGQVCLAASLLGEKGVPVACEGDVNGAVAMLALTLLGGEPVHNTDLLDPIAEDDAIVFSHCGSGSFSLARRQADIELRPVRLMDRGVCCRFPARPGTVTLVNLVPQVAGYKLAVAVGEALPTGMVFPGNPLKVRFSVPYTAVLDWVVAEGLGHHWMIAHGDYGAEIARLAALTGCELASPPQPLPRGERG